MLKIGEFAALAQITIRMLRHYDEMGLLKPERVDRESGYRYYTLDQLPRLNRILALKDLGLSLDEIRLLLDEALTAEEIRGILKLKQVQLHHHITTEQARLRRVENRLRHIEQEGRLPETDIVIKSLPAMHIMSLCGHEPPGMLFRQARSMMEQGGLTPHIQGALTLYHGSMEYQRTGKRSSGASIEVAYLVSDSVLDSLVTPDGCTLRVADIPAYPQVASLISTRPDHERHLDARALWQWMSQHRCRLVAPAREIYLRRPRGKQTSYLTEMLFPIEAVEQKE